MRNTRISIIGNGFVGNAIFQGMRSFCDISVFDTDESKSINTFEECISAPINFICVPTPSCENGTFDLSYLISVLNKIPTSNISVIKSTTTPQAAEKILRLFPKHRIVFNPEFLTERTAVDDFKNQSRIVVGGTDIDTQIVCNMYRVGFPDCEYIQTDHKTACFIKYFCNCFFATKVSLMNEFYQIATRESIDWDTALGGLLSSGWVNPMHTKVPGPDGNFGFGGKCFPKDIQAFFSYADYLGIDAKILKAAWKKNLEVREDRNWERISGAISKKNKEKT